MYISQFILYSRAYGLRFHSSSSMVYWDRYIVSVVSFISSSMVYWDRCDEHSHQTTKFVLFNERTLSNTEREIQTNKGTSRREEEHR
jgi:hypothetical protein